MTTGNPDLGKVKGKVDAVVLDRHRVLLPLLARQHLHREVPEGRVSMVSLTGQIFGTGHSKDRLKPIKNR